MGIYTDEQLAQIMCQIYVDYYDTKTALIDELIERKINQGIKELSNKTHKTESYLKAVLDEYFKRFTMEQQRKIKITKEEIRRNRNKAILDRLEGLSDEQIKEYLKTNNTSVIIDKLKKIIEGKDEEKANKARKKLEQIKAFLKEKQDRKNEEYKNTKYLQIKEIFDEMISNGYFSILHFSKEFHKEYCLEYDAFRDLLHRYMKDLKVNYPKDYNYYQYLLEQNTWISWEKNRCQIERIISESEKYDIVDYYMHINLPPKSFLQLCKYMLTDEEYTKIKSFISKYFEQPSYNPITNPWIIAPNCMINNEAITIETQEMILKFMGENNIPSNFFTTCLTKYRNNELNIEKPNVKSLN